jgi:glucose repression mediator protein
MFLLTRNQYDSAKAAYKRVLDRDPKHAKVLQQLGWLHHQQSTSFQSQEQAIDYLEQSVNSGKSAINGCCLYYIKHY